MFVSDIGIKSVVTVPRNATLQEVAAAMRQSHVGSVVVVDEAKNGRLLPVGLVTDRDIVVETTGQGAEAENFCADDIMSDDVTCIKRDAGIKEAIGIMTNKAIRRLPVIDEKGFLCGIITADDIFAYLTAGLQAMSSVSPNQRFWEMEVRST
jgi:CBS domain-containing protein